MLRALLVALTLIHGIVCASAQIGPVPGGGNLNPTPPPPACTEAANWLARNANLDNPSIINSQNLICGMVADGDFCGSKFDAIYPFAINNLNSALLNLCGTQFTATRNPGVNFVANEGFSTISGNTAVFVNSNFTPSTAGGNFTLNAAHVSVWAFSGTTDSNTAVTTSTSTFPLTAIYPARPSDSKTYCRINDSNPPSGGFSDTDSTAWFVCNRSGASATQLYKDGSLFGSPNNTTSGSLIAAPVVFALGTSQRVGIGTIGGSLDSATIARVYARFCTYLTAQRGSCTAPPTVAITFPSNGATGVMGQVNIAATASAPGGISSVQVTVDGNNVCFPVPMAPFGCSWDSTFATDGTHSITAKVTDNAGNTATASPITITTNNGTTPSTYEIATSGSDSNPCSVAQPCQTIAKANSIVYRAGDTLLLHGTDSFVGCLAITPTNFPFGSPSIPLTIGSDGAGTATITSNCTGETGVISQTGGRGVTWHDLNIRNGSTAGTQPRAGFMCANTASLGVGAIILQNLDIGGFHYITTSGGAAFGADVMCEAFNGGPTLDGLQLINSTLHGLAGNTSNEDIGMFLFGTKSPNVLVKGTIAFNIGGTAGAANTAIGIEPSDSLGAETIFSLIHDIGANPKTCGGPAGYETTQAVNPYVHFTEVYNVLIVGSWTASACDNDEYDFDVGTSGGLGEDLYGHNSTGIDYLIFDGTAGGIASGNNGFRNSIAENSYLLPSDGGTLHMTGASSGGLFFIQMTAYTNTAGTTTSGNVSVVEGFGLLFGPPNSVFANNIVMMNKNANNDVLFMLNNGGVGACSGPLYTNVLFESNDWFQTTTGTPKWAIGQTPCTSLASWQATAPGRDTGATTGDPGVTSAGGGGTLTWTPSTQATWAPATNQPTAYQLTGGSAVRSSGSDLSALVSGGNLPSLPTRDYYGLIYPGTGNCVSIGANNACP